MQRLLGYYPLTALAIPTLAFAALTFYMPSQYRFVLMLTSQHAWTLALSVLVLCFFAGCAFAILGRREWLSPATALFASLPIASALLSLWIGAGWSMHLLATSVAAIAFVLLLYRACGFFGSPPIWAITLLAGFPYLCAVVAHAISPIAVSRALGAFLIFSLFVGLIGVWLFALLICMQRSPLLTVAAVLGVSLLGPNDHVVPTRPSAGQAIDVARGFQEWLQSRRDLDAYKRLGLPYPVIFVSADGGGIYAAAHAYAALSVLDQRCPTFTQHVIANIGVSGGALGNAMFDASVKHGQRDQAPCAPGPIMVEPAPIVADHFSPVLGRFLLLETVDRLIPGQWVSSDRGSILTRSFQQASADPAFLDKPIAYSWDPAGVRPALFAVATDIENGRRFVMSPMHPTWSENTGEWWPNAGEDSISAIEAASISARFPWLTPTARLEIGTRRRLFADGGYFENSGAETVLDLVNELRTIAARQDQDAAEGFVNFGESCRLHISENFRDRVEWSGCAMNVFLIHLAITSTKLRYSGLGLGDGVADPVQSFVRDPIATLLSTRRSRGELALLRSSTELCGSRGGECVAHPGASMGFFRSFISTTDLDLPLGWYLPPDRFQRIVERAVPRTIFDYRDTARADEEEPLPHDLAYLIYHLDTEIHVEGNQPFIDDLLGAP